MLAWKRTDAPMNSNDSCPYLFRFFAHANHPPICRRVMSSPDSIVGRVTLMINGKEYSAAPETNQEALKPYSLQALNTIKFDISGEDKENLKDCEISITVREPLHLVLCQVSIWSVCVCEGDVCVVELAQSLRCATQRNTTR